MDTPPTYTATTEHVPTDPDVERIRLQRARLTARHSQALARLMAEREDLRGVHDLADFAFDALRWSA